jgi:alpha-tubulin suppressor-like RCC1 family protein
MRRARIETAPWLAALSLVVLLASCSDDSVTGMMLVVDADESVRGTAATLEVRISGEKGGDLEELEPLTYGEDEPIGWPRRVAIVPKGGDSARTLRVHVLARQADVTVAFVEARVITGYVRGERLTVRVTLASDCVGVPCGSEETCFRGECVDPRTAWQPEPLEDGGVGDGGDDGGPCEGAPSNACGGCGMLAVEPGTACGFCGVDEYVCDGTDQVSCNGDTKTCWKQVATGGSHTCGLRWDGSLWCWGWGSFGQRGDSSTDNYRYTPTQVLAAGGGDPWSDWVGVTAGAYHTCGLREGGTLWCWGYGEDGQRGDASTAANRTTPVQVLGTGGGAAWSDWASVTAGAANDHMTCGRRTNGTLWCWGRRGTYGNLGDGGTTSQAVSSPVQVVAAAEVGGGPWTDWVEATVGSLHACGRRTNGTLWCWGYGGHGMRGDGTTTVARVTPVQVLAQGAPAGGATWNDWSTLSAGGAHACGRRTNGTLWCWGAQSYGRLGDGIVDTTFDTYAATPTQVLQSGASPGGAKWSDWTDVSLGTYHGCGRRADGTLWCWGDGQSGRRGDATTGPARATPAQVLATGSAAGGAAWSDWLSIAVGGSHACGIREGWTLWCWGEGSYGQRGDGDTSSSRTTPAQVF